MSIITIPLLNPDNLQLKPVTPRQYAELENYEPIICIPYVYRDVTDELIINTIETMCG